MPDTALEQSSSALPGTHTEHASRHADSAHVGRRRTVVGVILIAGVWALACFPFIWLLAKQIGGRPAIFPACLLFSLSPLSLYYSTEGRMYSLMWFLAVCLAWLTLKLNQHGPRLTLTVPWVLT